MKIFAFALASIAVSGNCAVAMDLEQMCEDGFGVLVKTEVVDEFDGCENGKRINFENGLYFVCSSYSYHYAYRPTVLILKNVQDGRLAVMIDKEKFDGQLYR